MKRRSDSGDDLDTAYLGIGSLHSLDDFEPGPPQYNGPKVNMGFHAPEKAWIIQSKKKPRAKK